jgi:putative peptidoglycan lipid II flippase
VTTEPAERAEPAEGRGTIARRAGIVAIGTLASRILGAVRDAVMAAVFTTAATDAFVVAFSIPNALRVLLGEGAASGAFIPVLTEVRAKEGEARARTLYSNLTGAMLIVLALVSIAGVALAPWLVPLYASGYEGERAAETTELTRIVFPYIFFMGLAALAGGALNASKRFVATAFAPTLLNVALIVASFALVPVVIEWGFGAIAALAFGALAGGFLQFVVQLPSISRAGLSNVPRFDLRDPYVKKAFRLLVPLLVALGVYQLNVILGRQFASFLPAGAQSYLYYAQRIVEIPQGMFALAVATAALPTLSRLWAEQKTDEIRATFARGLGLNLFVALPSSAVLFVLAEPLCAVFFGRGRFGALEIASTADALRYQALGIWAVASVRACVPMFYAMNDTRSPIGASAANLVVFGALAWALLAPLEHSGISIALSAASIAQLGTLLFLLRRRVGRIGFSSILKSSIRIAIATVPPTLACAAILPLSDWSEGSTVVNVTLFALASLAAVVLYFGAAKLLRAPELDEVLAALRRRRR